MKSVINCWKDVVLAVGEVGVEVVKLVDAAL